MSNSNTSQGTETALEIKKAKDRARSRRKRPVKGKTIQCDKISKIALEKGRELYPDVEGIRKPRTRAECVDSPRPCPFVSCKHNLYLDVTDCGSIKVNFPDIDPDQVPESCALDVAEKGGATLDRVAGLMNLTKERVRQLEIGALSKLVGLAQLYGFKDIIPAARLVSPEKRRALLKEYDEELSREEEELQAAE